MDLNLYKKDLKECLLYTSIILFILVIIDIFKLPYFSVLTGSNITLAIIAIPCCMLYYSANNKSASFYIYLLLYTSICIECITKYNLAIRGIAVPPDTLFSFIYRTILLSLLLHTDTSFVKFCMKHTKIIYGISVLINLFTIFLNSYFMAKKSYYICFHTLFILLVITSYIIVLKLMYHTLKQHNFILTIYIISIFILRSRMFFFYVFNFFKLPTDYFDDDTIFFFFTVLIVLVGLFVKAKQIILINKGLNKDVKSISADIKEIKELEKARSHFFANLSHELKTPVNIISSALQLLEINDDKGDLYLLDTYHKYEKTLKQNTYRMIRLTNNFVDLSKIDAGFFKLNFKNYNIVELVENITMSVLFYVENKNINILFDTTDEEIYIKCDSDAIERIILNLLSNSLKFTQKDGNILVDISKDSNYVYIKVKDDGCGIDDSVKEHVFDMYVQGDKSLNRKNEGSGIGLSLVSSLVSLHGGAVYLSDATIGTEIILKIPNVPLDEGDVQETHDINDSSRGLVEKIDIEFSDIYDIQGN